VSHERAEDLLADFRVELIHHPTAPLRVRFIQAGSGERHGTRKTIKEEYTRMLEALHLRARGVNRVYGELFVTCDAQAEPTGFNRKAQEAFSRKTAGNLDKVDLSVRKIAC
jgi:hypothetical protein